MNESSNRGIVYIATGEDFVKEARISAESVKSVMPDVSITLFTDRETDAPAFDSVLNIDDPRHDFGDQVYHLDRTPYERTIFLDSDIYLDANIADLFDILDEFDIAVAHNQTNYSSERIDIDSVEAIPDSFPEYNSGVVAFRSSPVISEFFEMWRDAYAEVLDKGQIHNQAAFRHALYNSSVRISTLPSEYNCIFRRPGCVNGEVKVFHGRLANIQSDGAEQGPSIEQAVDELNRRTDLRTYYRAGDRVHLSEPSLFKRAFYSIQDRGVINTLNIALSRIRQ